MGYELSKKDIMDFASMVRIENHIKGDELFFKFCPYCNGGHSHDKDTFSVNLGNGTFKCFRASCDKHGHFVELARDFNFQLDYGQDRKYKQLPQKEITIRPKAARYLATRGISEGVVKRYKITTQKSNESIIVFPFFDENNILQFIKYRNTAYQKGKGSKEWCEQDTKPILFGMVQCEGFEQLIITEGQIDSLTLAECGFKNAVSVPTGALGFTWLTNIWDWITKFQEIIVFGDNEKGKMTLLDELQRKLTVKIKAVRIEDYLGEKDANAILIKYGKQAVINAVNNAIVPPVAAVKQLADVKSIDIYNLPHIKTNITEIDRVIGGLYFGQIAILTGKRGEGKSTFMSQLICEALEQDFGTFIYSGELTDYHFKNWIDFQLAGKHNIKSQKNVYGDEVFTLDDNVKDKISNWYRDKAFIYDNNYIADSDEFDTLTQTIEKTIRQYDVKLICIDNLMTAIDVGMDTDLYKSQSKFVKDLKQIANKYNVMVILVAHPRKSKDGFTNDDVSGSSDITNRVDLVINYARNNDKEVDCDGLLSITKNRLTGRLTGKEDIKLLYSQSTKRISSFNSEYKKYGWEKVSTHDKVIEAEQDLPF